MNYHLYVKLCALLFSFFGGVFILQDTVVAQTSLDSSGNNGIDIMLATLTLIIAIYTGILSFFYKTFVTNVQDLIDRAAKKVANKLVSAEVKKNEIKMEDDIINVIYKNYNKQIRKLYLENMNNNSVNNTEKLTESDANKDV